MALQSFQLSSIHGKHAPTHLAIGVFDGLHRGHQIVLQEAVEDAHRGQGVPGLLTFRPHPSRLFRPSSPTKLLMPEFNKLWMLEKLGIRVVIIEPFTRELASIEAEDFLAHLLQFLPSLRAVYVGENFRYGHKRKGDAHALKEQGEARGVKVKSLSGLMDEDELISSSRIRSYLQSGFLQEANRLLGYHYFSFGEIIPGRKLGRQIGFPTLNMVWEPELCPAFGVYLVKVHDSKREGSTYEAIANYGLRPTVETEPSVPLLEIHLLSETCPFQAGDEIYVEWLSFLR